MPEGGFVGADTSIYKQAQQPNMLQQAAGYGQLALGAQQFQAGQLEIAQKKIGLMSNAAKSVLALPNPTVQDAGRAMYGLVQMGAMDPKDFARESANAAAAAAADPQNGIRNWAAQHAMQLDSAANAMAARTGSLGWVDNGDGMQAVNVNPVTNSVNRAGGNYAAVPKLLSPTERASQVSAVRNGQQGTVPLGTLVDERGNPRLPVPAAPQAGAPASATMAPRGMAPAGGSPAPAAAPAGPAPVAGFNATALPPGVANAQEVTAQSSAKQGVELQQAADGAQTRKAVLNNLEQDLGKFESGPMAESLRKAKSTANQVGSLVGVEPFDKESIAAQEKFVKNATILAQQQFQALGGTGSDQQLGSAMRSNPTEYLSKLGNQQIVQMLKGNEDAIAAKNKAWQEWKKAHGADSYGEFAQEFNRNFEPRAFQWVYMSPKERADLYHSMTPNEQAQLKSAVTTAKQNGWIKAGQ